MNRTFPVNIKLYDSVYGNDFPDNQYYLILFDCIPSKLTNKTHYDRSIKDYFLNNGYVEDCRIESTRKNYDNVFESLMINKEKKIMVRYQIGGIKNTDLSTIDFFYCLENGELDTQINLEDLKKYIREKKKSNIQLVKSDMGHLDTEEYDLASDDINIELNYGSEFKRIHEIIVKRLNKENDKGIILLHGDPGTGKTSYLKYLTKHITNKDILFIPPSMAEMLSEPSIIPFLMEKKNSILIIEDAERVIGDREGNASSAGVSNILNLTDGILGDCLNIQVIATFNMKREKIDQALLRKGRLIAEHKFTTLTTEDTNKLLEFLKKDITSDKGLTLADIYNIDADEVRVTKGNKKIGF
jgi:SpoVK/Ycf46/Vps4 family AAA+-type ATPase